MRSLYKVSKGDDAMVYVLTPRYVKMSHPQKKNHELSWWPSGCVSVLPMPGAQGWSLGRKLDLEGAGGEGGGRGDRDGEHM